MLCLEHLIEHENLHSADRLDYENVHEELKTFAKIYSSCVNEEKLRGELKEKLDEHRRIVAEAKFAEENQFNDVEELRTIVERLKKTIEKSSDVAIVKVESIEEMNTSSPSNDELVSISFDRVANLVIDTDFHRRQSENSSFSSNETSRIKSENPRMLFDQDGSRRSLNVYIRNVEGHCPLWKDGSFGLTQEQHGLRLCYKKRFSDLNDHLRRYHGLLSSVAYFLTRATQLKVSPNKQIFPSDLQVVDPHRTFLCPMNDQCQMRSWVPSSWLKRHLISVHQMNTLTAQMTMNNLKSVSRAKSTANIRSRAFDVIRQVDLLNEKSRQRST